MPEESAHSTNSPRNDVDSSPPSTRRSLQRTFTAALADMWALWTTKAGIESWWGPEGFAVTVQSIDLRARGELLYTMHAVGEQMIAFMQQNKMPTDTAATITYREVVINVQLSYIHCVDFVPGLATYDVATTVTFLQVDDGVRIDLTFDPMHDAMWTKRAVDGWLSQLNKLDAVTAQT